MYKTTLDQWLVFNTIVKENGYSAAAKALNRSQSTVSYSMAKLQSQLGVELLVVNGKQCELTTIGQTLLHRSQRILAQFEQLEQTTKYLSDGVEAKLTLAVEYLFPKELLFQAIVKYPRIGIIKV